MKSKILVLTLALVLILSLCALVSCGACEHEYDELVIADATCNEAGSKTLTCKKCGEEKTEEIPATGAHIWNGGKETAVATCGAEGKITYTCKLCKTTKDEPIPATGEHVFVPGEILKSPTCVTPGTRKTVCSECGTEGTEPVSATGIHDYEEVAVLTAPTCYQEGSMSMKCKDCSAPTTASIPATGEHVASANVESNETEHWFACATEGCTAKVNAVAHEMVDGDVITASEGCKDGSKNVHCSGCTYATTAPIPATGAHTFGALTLSENKESASVTCSLCEATKTFSVKYNFDNETTDPLKFIGSSGGLNLSCTKETDTDGNKYHHVIATQAYSLNTESQFQVHNPFTADKGVVSMRLRGGANVSDFDIISYDVKGDFGVGVNGNTTKGCNLLGVRNGVVKTGIAGGSNAVVCTLSETEWTEITIYFEFDYEAKTVTVDFYVNGAYVTTWVGTDLYQTARSSIYAQGHIYVEGAYLDIDDFIVASAN